MIYTYDNGGNILSKVKYPYTVGAVSGAGTTISYTYGDSSWGDLLTAYNGEAITYDEIGNPLSYRNGMSFEWDGGRKLTSFSTPNAVGEYVYNADGIRVYKEVNGNTTEYYLSGTQIDTEITNYGGVTRRADYIYDENGSIYGFVIDNTDKYYYLKNVQGDIIGILDNTGTQIVEYSYDAWGKSTISYPGIDDQTETEKQARYLLGSNNPFRYRSYYFDVETGFYYLNSRYYDPEIGRFINLDGQLNLHQGVLSGNLFAYCLNNPASMVDYDGKDAIYVVDYGIIYGLPVFGHSRLFLQDAEGNWYMTEFTGSSPSSAKVYLKSANMDTVNSMIDGKTLQNLQYTYLHGDFTESLSLAEKYKDSNYNGYDFFGNNCLHYVRELIGVATFENSDKGEYIKSIKTIIPDVYQKRLKAFESANNFVNVVKKGIEYAKEAIRRASENIRKFWVPIQPWSR